MVKLAVSNNLKILIETIIEIKGYLSPQLNPYL